MSNSGKAACDISKSRKRYDLQDRMLLGIHKHPRKTAKEVARAIDLQYEEYCDAPKRVHDLKLLGKIEVAGSRECSVTGKTAEIYVVANGVQVGKPSVVTPQPVAAPASVEETEGVGVSRSEVLSIADSWGDESV